MELQKQLSYLNQFGSDKIKAMVLIDTGPNVTGASYDEWVWYLNNDVDGASRWFTEGIIENREQTIKEFVTWMLENPTAENINKFSEIADQTPSSVASILNSTGFYLDYSDDLAALDEKMPMLYVVRNEKKNVASKWIISNTPSATAVYMGKHIMFWERPDEFNKVLDDFLSCIDNN